jgi:hypothetical protein
MQTLGFSRTIAPAAIVLAVCACSGTVDSPAPADETGGAGGTVVAGGAGGSTPKGGSAGTGGSVSTGGSSGTGGSVTPGPADATELSTVSGWLTNTGSGLDSWAYTNIKKNFPTTDQFNGLVGAIVRSCAAFAPALANWQRYCEAVLSSAIVSESSYDPAAGTTSGGNDPTVGLLQIRFSSTVQDYNSFGSLDKMAAIGCAWPAEFASQKSGSSFWSTSGGSTYLAFMQIPACNIGLAAWYYFINATGNGGSSAVYAYQYCQGQGVAGDMVIGLLSHLMGPAGAHPPDPNNAYVTGIKTRVVKLLGGLPSPDPFGVSLPPEQTKFCR